MWVPRVASARIILWKQSGPRIDWRKLERGVGITGKGQLFCRKGEQRNGVSGS